MTDYTASVKIKLQDQFSRSAKAVAKSAERVSKSSVNALNKTKKVGAATAKTFDRVRKSSDKATSSLTKLRSLKMPGGIVGGIFGGAALAMEARRIATLEERYGRLGIQADMSDAQIAKMRATLEGVSSDLKIDPKEMLAGVEQIVEKTGDLDFAIANLENMGKAIQATGSFGIDIGATLAEFQKGNINNPEIVKRMLDTLILQGKGGAFTLQNFASQSSRLFPAISAYGFGGEKAIEQLGTVSQVARMGTGSGEQATTAVESILKNLSAREDLLNDSGIRTKNEDGSARDVTAVLEDLIRVTNGNVGKLTSILGDEGYRGISALLKEFRESGTFSNFNRFKSIKGDGNQLDIDTFRAMKFKTSKVQTVLNKKDEVSEEYFGMVINGAANIFDSLTGDKGKISNLEDDLNNKIMMREIEKQVRARIDSESKQKIEIKLKKSPDLEIEQIKMPDSNLGIIVEDSY